jgi:uncharacterized delta-60 repeat protein
MKKYLFCRLFLVSQLILCLSFLISPVKAAGEVDTSFVASVFVSRQTGITQTVVQPDGKILIAGDFNVVGKYGRTNVARLNADGTIDLTFKSVDLTDNQFGDSYVRKLALQADGKILVGGAFAVDGLGNRALIRLNPDGSLDATFSNRSTVSAINELYDLIITPEGKIVYSAYSSVGRLSNDGALENQTGNSLRALSLQADGKIVAYNSSSFKIQRYNPDLTLDNTFQQPNVSYAVYDTAVQADGKILIAGALTAVNNFPISRIARLNPDGTIDNTFNIGTSGPNNTIRDIELLSDGKILIGGDFNTFNGAAASHVARLNPADGSLDATFNSGIPLPNLEVYDLAVQPDGKIVTASVPMFRLNPDGSLDASFVSPVIGDFGAGERILVQPDGKFLVGGYFTMANEKTIKHLARFNADGSVDNTFNQIALPDNGQIFAIALQPDGKIVVGGNGFGGAARFNPDGSFDRYLNVGNIVYDVKIQADGKILVGGDSFVTRFNADGTLDNTFNSVGGGRVYKMAIQPDGKIVIVGSFTEVAGVPRSRVARLNTNGSLDTTFNPAGGANATVNDVALQADGKIVIGGSFTGVNFDTTKKYLARLNADGSLDASFTPVIETYVLAIRLQPDGKILAGGITTTPSTNPVPGKLVRVNPDGSLDASFNNSIPIDQGVRSIDLQGNKIILAGRFTRVGGVPNLGVARLLNGTSRTVFDFDGDGKSDLSIFRPSAGQWWINKSSGGSYAAQFGTSTDKLTPGDFTGDGKTDIAFFRPSTGEWFVLRSEDNSYYSFAFGSNGDVPVVGDFDSDGKADNAVFRPSNSTWYIRRSSDGAAIIQQFGQSGDVPVTADYDGDGKADIAIYRPAAGEWWIQRSTAGLIAFQFGNSADKPVQGDYTGDGKADVAFFRPSTGEWFILRSENQTYYAFPFGASGDIPAPGDYDGDGRFDATVFRPSNSTWYSNRSTAGTLIQAFGQAGDKPVPNAFVP